MLNAQLTPATSNRVTRSLALRTASAELDAFAARPAQEDNGDEEKYPDKAGTYTKGVQQKSIGVVQPDAYKSFKKALTSGSPADFEAIVLGGTRTLNGPQGGLAFYLDCLDGDQYKLACNISFGHGIHAGIHWRSDTDTSLLLGEAVALSYLRDRARTYNEPFSMSLTKLDGPQVSISNP